MGCLMILGVALLQWSISGLLILLAWNFVLSPLTGWQTMAFWQAFILGAVINFIGGFSISANERK